MTVLLVIVAAAVLVASLERLRHARVGAVKSALRAHAESLARERTVRIDFVANVSHELRTPLTAIKGYADTLAQDLDAGRPVEREFVDAIARNASRLMSLINDLLDLSSIESHADELVRTRVSTAEASAHALKNVESAMRAKQHAIRVANDVDTVYADPRRLEQVLVNLLDNACKYTPAGGAIRVAWERAEDGGILLKIIDNGPGIAEEHRSRLFERFYRVDKARSRELGGTGLGLAIVKHILQRHGGAVWVESVAGRGSTFVCRFPEERAG